MSDAIVDEALWSAHIGERVTATVRYAASTHPRTGSTTNQDAFVIRPPVFVVADGMGGHRAGDAASGVVAEEFHELANTPNMSVAAVHDCVARCHARVRALGRPGSSAPGSTLVALVLVRQDDQPYWLLVNLGDSRAYRLVDNVLGQLSHDHSVVQELVDSGEIGVEEARVHAERHVITRAVGVDMDAKADYSLIPVTSGSMLVLCSDGVSSELDDARIRDIVAGAPGPAECARHLIAAAMAGGGRDDATAVVIEVVRVGTDAPSSIGSVVPAEVDTVPGGAR